MVRTGLALLLALWTPVQAAEPAFDALSHLLREYAGPVDEAAARAPAADAPPESGERLAKISADLSLMAAGFETFRNPAHSERALGALPDYVAPELKPFFKDRDSSLDALYRTLAVTDYTSALRFPDADCEPRERRSALLGAKDGLFADAKGGVSPWLSRLLGPSATGAAADALDRASSEQAASGRDYELLRAKVARIDAALRSEKAVGAERAKLYCRRAQAHETLAAAHRVAAGPVAAGRELGDAAPSVLLLTLDGRAVGAGTAVETAGGIKVLTDRRLAREGSALRAHARGKNGALGPARAFTVEKEDPATGVLIGRVDGEPVPALALAAKPAAAQDLVRAVGHVTAAGPWTTSQGLVTGTAEGTFVADALLGPDMVGGAVLNEAGELAGLIVLSPAGSPAAISAERLRSLVTEGVVPGKAVVFIASEQSGSGSVLTAADPFVAALKAPGGDVVEAGLPATSGGVNWEGGGSMGDFRPRGSAGRPPSSSYGGSSSSGGAEMGQALGQAMAPLVQAMIFQGIPALFRGIGSLFQSRPSVQVPYSAPQPAYAAPRPQEKPAEPPKPQKKRLKPTGIVLTVDPAEASEGEVVTLTAKMSFESEDGIKGGLSVEFTGAPEGAVFSLGPKTMTNGAGVAVARFTVGGAARESVAAAPDAPAAPVQAKPSTPKEATRAHAGSAFDALASAGEPEDEETQTASAPSAGETAAPVEAGAVLPAMIVAAATGFKDQKEFKVSTLNCPPGTEAKEFDPEQVFPGDPAKGDMKYRLKLATCRDMEKNAAKACTSDDNACVEEKLKELGYYSMECDKVQPGRPDFDNGSSPTVIPKPKKPLQRKCMPVQAKTKTAPINNYKKGEGNEGGPASGGRAPEYPRGRLTVSELLNAMLKFLGDGYKDMKNGRFLSADGQRQVRMGNHEMKPPMHAHFEALVNGKVVENARVDVDP